MGTVFQTYPKERSAFINPEDFMKRNPDFPKLCVSTFSKGIIDKFAALDSAEVIGHLYTANGETPVYRIIYKHTPIAFYLSRVGAPACVAGIEEIFSFWLLNVLRLCNKNRVRCFCPVYDMEFGTKNGEPCNMIQKASE